MIFDPAKAWEFELRRKRAGHLLSKHRYLSAQFEAYLTEDLWLRLAARANAMGARMAQGLSRLNGVELCHPVEANLMFTRWMPGTNERLRAAGAVYYGWAEAEADAARLVASWSTTEADVDGFLDALRKVE